MEVQLREVIGRELHARHGYGLMEGKIKPVHIANTLIREEHQLVGKMADIKNLMAATAPRETTEARLEAVKQILERSRERWGRLGEEADLKRSLLTTRVLPLLRTILATDGAAFGTSPEFSSFSSPTVLTVTRDPSDEQAGAFIHRVWTQPSRLRLLDILKDLTSPDRDLSKVDDLTAVLVPLTDTPHPLRPRGLRPEIHEQTLTPFELRLREAATDLASYEDSLLPNPMATLQRIILLASISVFFHASTRAHETAGLPRRVLLIDASNSRTSSIAEASEGLASNLFSDAREYMAYILRDALRMPDKETGCELDWVKDPETAMNEVFRCRLQRGKTPNLKELIEAIDELHDTDADLQLDLPRRLIGLLDSSGGRTLDGYIRLLGLRCGLLYPQQKNPLKRLVLMDRTLEVLVASTFSLSGPPLEFRDFLDKLYDRWGLIVGGRIEDSRLLAEAGKQVSSAELTENSERFLNRLRSLGMARMMADSVAVVGLMENVDAS